MRWPSGSGSSHAYRYESCGHAISSMFGGEPDRRGSLALVSENICYTDAYARQTDAVVIQVDSDASAVVLDRTVFYPGGGGQPADTGQLIGDSEGSWMISGANKRGEDIWHTIDGELPAPDTQVSCEINWDRRHRLMRTHSALHVLCGVVWRDHQASVTGGNMEPLSANGFRVRDHVGRPGGRDQEARQRRGFRRCRL